MQQPELKTAEDVSKYLLKETGDAITQQDFDRFSSVFALPHQMTTAQSEVNLLTPRDLRNVFEQTCERLAALGMTELRRTCEAAAFDGPDRVKSTHISQVIKDGKDIVTPYPVYSIMERQQGLWKVVSSNYALWEDSELTIVLDSQPTSSDAAMVIYQDHLDRATKTIMDKDMEGFIDTFKLPHIRRTQTTMQRTTTRVEMENKFHKFGFKYAGIGMTDFVRIAKEAYFHADDDIRGIHESHLIRNGTRLIKPYPNRVRLKRCADGKWRETHTTNAIMNNEDRIHLWAEVSPTPELPDLDIDPERTT